MQHSADSSATKEKFGYYPSELTPGSRKQLVYTCEFCGDQFVTQQKLLKSRHVSCARCRSVAASYTMTGSSKDKHEYWIARRRPIPSCVDDGATLSTFGYLATSLAPQSKKPVVVICSFCKKSFHTSLQIVTRPSSKQACKKCDAVASQWTDDCGDKEEFRKKILDINRDGVDRKLTLGEFGYDPDGISTYSTKKIMASCSYCKDPVRLSMAKYSSRKGNIACSKCVRNKTVKTLQKKYGVSNTLDIPSVRAKLSNPMTEQIVESFLRDVYKVEFVRGHTIGPYSFDFYIPSCNLLIECQGDFFHGFKQNGYSGTPQDRAKNSYVESQTGHKLIWLWEHEIHMGRIKKVLDFHVGGHSEPVVKFSLRDLVFRRVPNADAHTFLSRFHYLGNLGTVATCYGAHFKDTVIAVCAFGGITRHQSIKKVNLALGSNFNPSQLRELRRFCIRPGVRVKNTGSFCLARFVKAYSDDFSDVRAVLSFADSSVDDSGTIYKASNWRQLSDTSPSYHYYDSQTNRRIHKRTVWDMAKGSHMPEAEFAAVSGLVVVKEDPKSAWLLTL